MDIQNTQTTSNTESLQSVRKRREEYYLRIMLDEDNTERVNKYLAEYKAQAVAEQANKDKK